jgi:hypothetical protein
VKLGIMQPYFFPYIGYFQLIHAVDKFVIYDLVSYRKASWINRNRLIERSSNKTTYIQVPVSKSPNGTLIEKIEIPEDSAWRKYLLRFIYFNYKKTPFFEEVYTEVELMLAYGSSSLHEFNSMTIKHLANWLDIKTEISSENQAYYQMEKDLSAKHCDSPESIMSERIFQMCTMQSTTHYINPIGGMDLYDTQHFQRNNIDLSFVKTGDITYPQFTEEFVPHLSILDMLFHNGREETKRHIINYTLL